ncbi:MAG: peptide deformylase [Nitrospiria bacterium]
MSALEILKYPDTTLFEKSKAVSDIDGDLQSRIDVMIETLYSVQGLGLAAPQVGDLRSFFIYDLSRTNEKQIRSDPIIVLNPEIIEMEGEEIADEGCLSIPGYYEKVKRAYRVLLKGFDREGKEIRIEGEGLAARLFQHEIDHLNGVLMLNRMSSLKRSIFLRKFKKQQKQAEK